MIDALRIHSRQQYLGKRTDQKIIEGEDELRDEMTLFDPSQLTEAEKSRIRLKQEIVKLAKEHQSLKDDEEKYQIPEGLVNDQGKIDFNKRNQKLQGKYVDVLPGDKTDEDLWQTHQVPIHHATVCIPLTANRLMVPHSNSARRTRNRLAMIMNMYSKIKLNSFRMKLLRAPTLKH